jgi:hypothetical protein
MQTDGFPSRKKVALLGIPDDALDVLNHYTQSTDWEAVVVVSSSPDAYAARMAKILGIPVQEIPNRDQLAQCDLVIVGSDEGMDVDALRDMLADTGVEISDLDSVTRELEFHPFEDEEPEPEVGGIGAEDIENALDGLKAFPVEEAGAFLDAEIPAPGDPASEFEERRAAAPEPLENELPEPELAAPEPLENELPEPELAAPERTDPARGTRTPLAGSTPIRRPGTAGPRKEFAAERAVESASGPRFDLSALLGRDAAALFSCVSIDARSPEFRSLLDRVLAATGAQTGSIMLPDADGEHLAIAAAVGLPREILAATRPRRGEGLAGRAFASGKPAFVRAEVPQFAEAGEVFHRVAGSVPIHRDGHCLGVLSVNVESGEPHSEERLLGTLEGFVEEALNAVLRSVDLSGLAPRARRELVFRELDAIMAVDASFPERLLQIAEALRRAVHADFAHVYLVDPLSQRLELISEARGISSTEGRYLSLDRGFYSWVVREGRLQLLSVVDQAEAVERLVACLPVKASRPYGLLVLENFAVRSEEKGELRELLASVIELLEEIFEVEQGVESQDVLAGLRMRIADKKNELAVLPPALRAQPALEFGLQILAAEAAMWLERPGARPVIAQPQTRQAARIVADAWDSLDTLCAWIREQGSTAWGGNGHGWDPGAPGGPAPYVGVREERGEGILIAFFSPGESGPSAQLPARILTDALAGIFELMPVTEPEAGEGDFGSRDSDRALDRAA